MTTNNEITEKELREVYEFLTKGQLIEALIRKHKECRDLAKDLHISDVMKSVCPLCDGKGRRVFPNSNPPVDQVCPACNGRTVL
jgi:DnaJ-class molecular chaperone